METKLTERKPRPWRALLWVGFGWLALAWVDRLWPGQLGTEVVVVYNQAVPESKEVAEHYANRRQVPTNQLIGFNLPTGESMTRAEFADLLATPLWKALDESGLFMPGSSTGAKGIGGQAIASRLERASIRFLALCYGVPTRILEDKELKEEGTGQLQAELRRNEAAVDSELACLPRASYRLTGPLINPLYGTTNAASLHPTNGLLLVARLDGPSAATAKGLVDKAIAAETNGLWGRAYFDARGLTEGDYKLGDDWIRSAARLTGRLGFETTLDEKPETFSVGFPMSQIALYAGWYDGNVSGPFTRPQVEFMPGAIGYHLHSFSALVLRTETNYWAGPLLAKGVTATLGSVAEPYLVCTPNLSAFFDMLIRGGYSFAEAAYASQAMVSWQNIAVGDPLYRPFARTAQAVHEDLGARNSPYLEWAHLRVINLNLATGEPAQKALSYLSQIPLARRSALLTEKAADLYYEEKQLSNAMEAYTRALELRPSPQQKVRIQLSLAKLLSYFGRTQKACDLYEQVIQGGYPEPLSIYTKLLPLAEDLGNQELITRYRREINRLSRGASN